MSDRIFLSPPHMSGHEQGFVADAFASNWIAPLGPHVDAFESEFARTVQVPHAAALSSGTAGLHLALLMLGVQPGDEILCSTLTFGAMAFAITYVGGKPIFVDCSRETWNMDPGILGEELRRSAALGRLPKAALVVDLYGQSADWEPILEICEQYEIPVIEDAAEALGATYRGRPVGSFGCLGVFSFNGNKIITTGGGGMLVSDDEHMVRRARFLATQARDPAPHYQHSEIGYNYRLSTILAAIGRGQLRVLEERVLARRRNFDRYVELMGEQPGLTFMPEAPYGRCTRWLTVVQIDEKEFGTTPEQIRLALERENIECRPVWKPMHLQPVFKNCRSIAGSVSKDLFNRGLCLPSGSSLTDSDIERIVDVIRCQCPRTT